MTIGLNQGPAPFAFIINERKGMDGLIDLISLGYCLRRLDWTIRDLKRAHNAAALTSDRPCKLNPDQMRLAGKLFNTGT